MSSIHTGSVSPADSIPSNILALPLNDPEREKAIRKKANSIIWEEGGEDDWLLGTLYRLTKKQQLDWMTTGYKETRVEFKRNQETKTKYDAQFADDHNSWVAHQDFLTLKSLMWEHQAYFRNVTKIVCFGLGSPHVYFVKNTKVDEEYKRARSCEFSSHAQYATARELGSLIKHVNGNRTVKIYAQDPQLTYMEIKHFPDQYGIEVVNPYRHKGYCLVDQYTLVISFDIAPTACHESVLMAVSRPVAMICTPEMDDDSEENSEMQENFEMDENSPIPLPVNETLCTEYTRIPWNACS
ncbi:hypothetical protein F4808DRAFT_462367 [Astrocystis sublimbata]|nr:hypothetical protein F4808DRAFT_462367 [Astrocystis sublimbata]